MTPDSEPVDRVRPECEDGARPDCRSSSLDVSADVYTSGMNGALRRLPRLKTQERPLLERVRLGSSWKAYVPKLKTLGLKFPDAVEFITKIETSKDGDESLRSIQPSGRSGAGGSEPGRTKKPTRLSPPSDALSLEDRLFYLLQPPLESWLGGQELIMPLEPFAYQYEGIAWLFSQKSALLADEMGLGKTMQAITAIRLLLRSGQARRILLVCPKPLIPNWLREFRMWAEEIPVLTVAGDASRRRLLWTMPDAPVLITNYELLVRDFEMFDEPPSAASPADGNPGCLPETPSNFAAVGSHPPCRTTRPSFDVVVLDEAQRIKNRNSLTAETARAITRRRSWALTGTPIENRPDELASLFEFLEVVPPRGTPDLRQLRRLAKDYILRRTKDRVMTDLPPRLDRDEYLELTPEQQFAYQAAEKEGVIHLNELGESISIQHVFELVLRLKQIANFDPLTGQSAKLERLTADMEEIADSGGKAILFSQWTRCIDWLQERLEHFGSLVYHGGVSSRRREHVLAQFEDDPDSHLLLMSYGTGAVGLNLQFAGYVFLFDRWWNPAVEDQAINRAHRIGTKQPVIVTKFISKDTIEERIDLVLRQKRELFEAVLGEGNRTNVSLSLNATEIFGLFDLKAPAAKGLKKIGPEPGGSAAREDAA